MPIATSARWAWQEEARILEQQASLADEDVVLGHWLLAAGQTAWAEVLSHQEVGALAVLHHNVVGRGPSPGRWS